MIRWIRVNIERASLHEEDPVISVGMPGVASIITNFPSLQERENSVSKLIARALTNAASGASASSLTAAALRSAAAAPAATGSGLGLLLLSRAAQRRRSVPHLAGALLKSTLGSVHWPTFAAGAAAAVVGPTIAKPLLVPLVKAGMSGAQFVSEVWEEANAIPVTHEVASADATAALLEEVRQLRSEVADLKASLNK